MKTYHFLAGLPRSGNTLLSSILNQNPNIYSSPINPLPSLLWSSKVVLATSESTQRIKNETQLNYVMNQITHNYFSNIKKSTIIIREKGWGTPANLQIIKECITPKPKIIFTVRPIIEVLTSLINILPEWSFVDQDMINTQFWYKDYLTKNDNRCDFLMQPQGMIDKTLYSFNEIKNPENKNVFCLIKYNDIVNSPQETMDKIYNFLELPTYRHNFNNIKKIEVDNDEALGQPINFHEVRPQLKKISQNPKEILSEYVINKYSNIGFDLG